ncbi:MAG: alpha/beta hydrolase [bacterium]|nr:alpha/beta hydrolase [bacterium]
MATDWLFFHGWALGPRYFKDLISRLPAGQRTWTYDRGYFGAPSGPVPPVESPVLVAHSFGLHLIPPVLLARSQALVVLAGFLEFHPLEARTRQVSQRGLQRMMKGLDQDLPATLAGFYDLAASPRKNAWGQPAAGHKQRLRQDLSALDRAQLAPDSLKEAPRALVLAGQADQVVGPAQAQALAQALPQAELITFDGRGHDLGFDDNDRLWQVISQWMPL